MQLSTTGVQYCMLIISSKFLSKKKEITVDFGERNSELITNNKEVLEATSGVQKFETLIDALNYMSSIGWQIEHFVPFEGVGGGTTINVYKYLIKRQLES